MREVAFQDILEKVKDACMAANFELGEDVIAAFQKAKEKEESPVGREILDQLLENAKIAEKDKIALCQDTGFAVCFVDLGDEVRVKGGNLLDAINEGVRQGYQEGYLRKSICHPFTRKNTDTNTPAIVHVNLVPGDGLKIVVAPKGGGSENMSRVTMLKPSDGIEGIKQFVIQRVKESGANPCPPLVIGVGIGGTFEKAALIAKKSLLRPLGSKNPDPALAALEDELLEKINELGIGPQGLGGSNHCPGSPCGNASVSYCQSSPGSQY